jgi:hypothetical protein
MVSLGELFTINRPGPSGVTCFTQLAHAIAQAKYFSIEVESVRILQVTARKVYNGICELGSNVSFVLS